MSPATSMETNEERKRKAEAADLASADTSTSAPLDETGPTGEQILENAHGQILENAHGQGRNKKPRRARDSEKEQVQPEYILDGHLRRVKPYPWVYESFAKGRWIGRELYEIFCVEFHDKAPEYYVCLGVPCADVLCGTKTNEDQIDLTDTKHTQRTAILSGKITVNHKVVPLAYKVKDNDVIRHTIHRHEPPVTSAAIKVVAKQNGILAVDKPSSIPVHASGRYHFNTVVGILQSEYPELALHRLDRLTSGLLLLATTPEAARTFQSKTFRKTYLCRVRGSFPFTKTTVNEPILTVNYKLGINIVSPEGKEATTTFTKLFYDSKTDTTVLEASPIQGRTHQIRVHAQWLGYPLLNDPLYGNAIWGDKGKGGVTKEETEEVAEKWIRKQYDQEGKNVDEEMLMRSVKRSGEIGNQDKRKKGKNRLDYLNEESTGQDKKRNEPLTTSLGSKNKQTQHFSAQQSTTDVSTMQDVTKCTECVSPLPDPQPHQMMIYLHAWKYQEVSPANSKTQGDRWCFESPVPEWAKEDFKGELCVGFDGTGGVLNGIRNTDDNVHANVNSNANGVGIGE